MKQTLILLFAVVFTACNAGKKTVQVWSSLPDTDRLLVDSTLPLKTSAEEIKDIVEIFPDQSCQTVLGVGAALTHSSAYVFHHHLDSVKRDSLFRVLFTPEGIGINYTRLCVGASDFSFNLFSYSEKEDFMLANFSIAEIIRM